LKSYLRAGRIKLLAEGRDCPGSAKVKTVRAVDHRKPMKKLPAARRWL